MSETLEHIIHHGNRGYDPNKRGDYDYRSTNNHIACADGFTVSVIAGGGCYCTPSPSLTKGACPGEVDCRYPGPYTHVEVGYPSSRPEPWEKWAEFIDESDSAPTDTVYGYVPVELVRELIASHGDEATP